MLVPVYEALELRLGPGHRRSGGGRARAWHRPDPWTAVRDALLAEYGREYELVESELDEQTLALARGLAAEHRPAGA